MSGRRRGKSNSHSTRTCAKNDQLKTRSQLAKSELAGLDVDRLRRGTLQWSQPSPSAFPPMEIVLCGNLLHQMSNRRLFVFRVLARFVQHARVPCFFWFAAAAEVPGCPLGGPALSLGATWGFLGLQRGSPGGSLGITRVPWRSLGNFKTPEPEYFKTLKRQNCTPSL